MIKTLSSLILCSGSLSFHSSLKVALLDLFKADIYASLYPQMGGFIDKESISLSILNCAVIAKQSLLIKCSVFYIERIGGCNCNDEPYAENGYCEMQFHWNADGLSIIKDNL